MWNDKETIDADRLIEAADAVLAGVKEIIAKTGAYHPPCMLMGTDKQPEGLWAFTREEVVQGTLFLGRMGMLPEVRA